MWFSATRRVRPFWIAVVVLGAVMLYQQYAVGVANRRLRKQLREIAAELVEPGFQMGRLTGFGLNGERASGLLAGSANPALVIGISVGCGVCLDNASVWVRITEYAEARGVRVYWVSRESPEQTKPFFATNFRSLRGLVISEPVYSTYQQIKLSAVPQTVLVATSGIVSRVWPGAISAASEAEIRDALKAVQ